MASTESPRHRVTGPPARRVSDRQRRRWAWALVALAMLAAIGAGATVAAIQAGAFTGPWADILMIVLISSIPAKLYGAWEFYRSTT